MDLLAWWADENLVSCDISGLQEWFPSKREGCWDVIGTLQTHYSGGSEFTFIASAASQTIFTIKTSRKERWYLDERNGSFTGPNNVSLSGKTRVVK